MSPIPQPGPIRKANIRFGDLTILIGPQASGKSLFLELFKLVKDHDHIVSTLKKYNYILGKTPALSLPEYYFGEGLSSLIKDSTKVAADGRDVTAKLTSTASKPIKGIQESVFYVPAQRILSIADGRPKNFMEFDLSTPYPLRFFSETLRVFVQGGLGNPDVIFPMKLRLKNSVKESINDSIFHNGKVILDQTGGAAENEAFYRRHETPIHDLECWPKGIHASLACHLLPDWPYFFRR